MAGIIIKDFINLRKNIKIFLAFIVIYGVMAFASQDSSFFSTVFTVLCAILTISLYSYDEMARWDGFALTMPISRDNIVQGKYIMMLLLTAIGVVVGILFTMLVYIFADTGEPLNSIQSCMVGAAIAIVFYSITIPIITKVGVEKARFILLAVYLIPFATTILIGKALESKALILPEQITDFGLYLWKHAYLFLTAAVLIVLGISYLISIRIYRKKEF